MTRHLPLVVEIAAPVLLAAAIGLGVSLLLAGATLVLAA